MALSEQAKLQIALEAKNSAGAAFGQLNSQLNGLVSTAKKAAIALAAAFAFKEVMAATERWGYELDLLRDTIGVTGEEASKLNYVMRTVGIDTETGAQAFAILSKKIGTSMQDIKNGTSVFDKFGVKVLDNNGNVKDFTTLLGEMNTAFATMPDGLAKTDAELEMFGRGGKKLHDLLSLTKDEIASLAQEAEDLGLVMSTKNVAAMEQFARLTNRAGLAFDALKIQIGNALLPMLTDLLLAFIRFIKDVLPKLQQLLGPIISGIREFATAVWNLWQAEYRVVGALLNTINAGQRLSGIMKVLGEAFRTVLGIIKAVTDRLNQFAQEIQDRGVFGALLHLAQDIMEEIGKTLGNVAAWVTENLPKWIAALGQLWTGLLTWLAGPGLTLWKTFWDENIVRLGDWLTNSIPIWLTNLGNAFVSLMNWIRNTGFPALVTFIEKVMPQFGQWIVDSLPVWIVNFGNLVAGVITWLLGTGIPELVKTLATLLPKLSEWAGDIGTWLINNAFPVVLPALGTFALKIVNAILDGIGQLGAKLTPLMQQLFLDFAKSFVPDPLKVPIEFIIKGPSGEFLDPFGIRTLVWNALKDFFASWNPFNGGAGSSSSPPSSGGGGGGSGSLPAAVIECNNRGAYWYWKGPLVGGTCVYEPPATTTPPAPPSGGGGGGGRNLSPTDPDADAARCEAQPWDGRPEDGGGHYQWNWSNHTCFPVWDRTGTGVPPTSGGGGSRMAEGGVVIARPGGTQVTVGEGGEDEAIVPLGPRNRPGMTGGVNIYIDAHDNIVDNEEALARRLARAMLKDAQLRRQFSF